MTIQCRHISLIRSFELTYKLQFVNDVVLKYGKHIYFCDINTFLFIFPNISIQV